MKRNTSHQQARQSKPKVASYNRHLRYFVPALVLLAAGCGQQEFRMPPYITQKGCEFTLVVSPEKTRSEKVPTNSRGNATEIAVEKYEIEVADCQLVYNPHGLPLYKD